MNLTLTFPQPNVPASENSTRGRNWASIRRDLKPWKDLAWVTAHNAWTAHRWSSGTARPITVQVDLAFTTNRRRDPHNYTSTVVKAIVDGLVTAGVVPDDTPDWVTVLEPTLTVSHLPICTVIIQERRP